MRYVPLLAIIFLLGVASATVPEAFLNFEEPSGTYPYGTIPVIVEYVVENETVTNASITAELLKGGATLETKEMVNTGDHYTCSFEIEEEGEYTIKAKTGEGLLSNETAFTVNSSKISLELASPENKTYAYSPDIKASVMGAGKFVHDAEVKATVYRNGTEVEELDLPEGRDYYWVSTDLIPGFYKVVVTASKDDQEVEESVEFILTGEVNGTFIPGDMALEIKRAEPVSSKYAVGSKTEINIVLVDKATGEKLRRSDAKVEARVITPVQTKEIILAFKDDQVNPKYYAPLLLDEKGWYEISVKATLTGYSNASTYFPPIKAGEEVVPLPEAMGCANGLCMKIHSPKADETFPINETVKLEVQVLEDVEEHPPIADAKVTAEAGGSTVELSYQKNGYYSGELGPLKEGSYEVLVAAEWQESSTSNTASFFVSPDKLQIALLHPLPGDNVTEPFITIQVRVTEQTGEVVSGANTRAIIETPGKAVHNVQLKRNAETGNYEAEFTFTDRGTHSVKVVASKQGYVSTSREFEFDHWKEEEASWVTNNEILLLVLLVGIIVILLALWKAF